ncbi:hypothetical protein GU927_001950 [Rhodobacteraceae bacterium HSP-20]|uniref:Curlin associated repeat-containing protein n=1 Tax=Paragemmobacter amnigenus TaxID=2852097 RepID=A0ABS6J011_9RHOB|nr:hypothetical protein [Rhodobacter amnigenus]MBU9696601.1 hypothetical protein [Rhodobacter amnigenus]MBV4387828.1 hypothetical protein [Rhodobacter amnigenus]
MRPPLLTLALIATLLPGLSAAQTTSTTIQSGDGNQSTTVQSGQTAAATIQAGDGNVASTTLGGTYNASVIGQWGSSNTLDQTLSGSNRGLFTQQIGILSTDRQSSTTFTGGNLRVSVTIRSELK